MCFKPYRKLLKIYVLLLPIFQRSFGFLAAQQLTEIQHFDWGCKSKSLFYFSKKYLKFFCFRYFVISCVSRTDFFAEPQRYSVEVFYQMVFEIFLNLFFAVMISVLFQKRVQRYVCSHSPPRFFKSFLAFDLLKNLLLFCEAGRKDKRQFLFAKSFSKISLHLKILHTFYFKTSISL